MTARRLSSSISDRADARAVPLWRIATPPAVTVPLVLLCVSSRHGFHGDELYFRMLEPAWWYEDQPPLTVWLARLARAASDAVWVHRLPAVAAAGAGAVVAAAFPRVLGYGPRVQRLAAWAHAFTVYPLLMGHVMLTASLDLLAWQGVTLGVVAALRGWRHGLFVAGLVAGLACWNKLLVLVLAAALFIALVVGARDRLRSGDAVRAAIAVGAIGGFPVMAQLLHGMPMLTVSSDLVERHGTINRALVVPLLVVFLGPPLAPIWWRGLWVRVRDVRSGRGSGPVLAIACTLVLVFTLVAPAQPYYAVAAFLPALAIGWGRAADANTGLWVRAPRVVAANGTIAALLCLPLVPPASSAFTVISGLDPVQRDQVGWPALAEQVNRTRGGQSVGVVTDSYALAGALTQFGPSAGLERHLVASGHNALWDQGPPTARSVLIVGYDDAVLRAAFTRCEHMGRVHAPAGDPFELNGTPMMRCVDPRGGWAAVWPSLRRLGG